MVICEWDILLNIMYIVQMNDKLLWYPMPRRRGAATVGIRGSTHDHTHDSGATQQQQQLPPHKRVTSPNPQTSEASRNTTYVWYKLLQPEYTISLLHLISPSDTSWTTLKEHSPAVIYYKLNTSSHQKQASTFSNLCWLFHINISINIFYWKLSTEKQL